MSWFRSLCCRLKGAIAPVLLTAALIGPAVVQAQPSPSAYTSAARYDKVGRQTGTISPDPDGTGPLRYAATRTTYDAAGRPIKVETGELLNWQSEAIAPKDWSNFTILSTLETTYDALDRKTKEVSKGNGGVTASVMQYSYDAVGRLQCTAERMNPAVFATLSAGACTPDAESTAFGADRITRNLYDATGKLLKVQKAVGTNLQQDYVTYTYTPNGKQQTVKDANGNLATYVYDGFDRLVAWRFPSKANGAVSANCTIGTIAETSGIAGPSPLRNAGDDCEKYGWDRNGNRGFLVKRDGSVLTYSYDQLNRMTLKVVPDRADLGANHERDVYYSYDLRGLQKSARYDSTSGDGVVSTYDGFGRLTSSTTTLYNASYALTYQYDKNGNRTQITHPGSISFAYSYDGLNRATQIAQSASTISALTYDPRGQRDTLTGGVTTNYDYDHVGRLSALDHDLSSTTRDVTWGFTYNPADQIKQRTMSNSAYVYTGDYNVTRSYAVNGLNQYTSAGPATFCYDDNGNLTSDGTWVYQYDIENRLVQMRVPVNAGCPDDSSDYAGTQQAIIRYDPLGRINVFAGATTPTTRFAYDGDALVAEFEWSSPYNVMHRYVHGPGVDEPLAWYEGSAVSNTTLRRLRANWQGSVVATTDSAGAIIEVNSYDDWGAPGANNVGRFQFTGQAWLPDFGLYHYKARAYSPTLGRFLQTDPVGYEDQINLYAYVANDPLNFVDPKGMFKDVRAEQAQFEKEQIRKSEQAGRNYIANTKRTGPLIASIASLTCSSQFCGKARRVYATYTKKRSDGTVYSGRASIVAPFSISDREAGFMAITRRDKGHHVTGYGPAVLDQATVDYTAIRGREQQLIDFFGGAISSGGTSGNKINAISSYNPLRLIYIISREQVWRTSRQFSKQSWKRKMIVSIAPGSVLSPKVPLPLRAFLQVSPVGDCGVFTAHGLPDNMRKLLFRVIVNEVDLKKKFVCLEVANVYPEIEDEIWYSEETIGSNAKYKVKLSDLDNRIVVDEEHFIRLEPLAVWEFIHIKERLEKVS